MGRVGRERERGGEERGAVEEEGVWSWRRSGSCVEVCVCARARADETTSSVSFAFG